MLMKFATFSVLFLFKLSQASIRSWKMFYGGPGKSWIFCQ